MKKIILSAILALFVVPSFAGATTANITQLVITTDPQTVSAGSVSAVMTVNTQNVSNASESLDTSGTEIVLNSSSPTGEFSSANSTTCGLFSAGPITIGMSSGSANKNFCYKDATPGTYTITISASGPDGQTAWATATQTITITPVPSATIVGGATYATIQEAITNATSGSTINVGPGTYTGTLNLGGKTLTIVGAGVGVTILDASASTGYAVQGFGDSSAVSDLTLKGTSNSYGFKVSGVHGITLENIKVENSKKTGVDLNGVDGATLTGVEVVGTISGFGVNMVDSRNITLTDITTSGNAWGGVSVQTEGYYYSGGANNIVFAGTFSAEESASLLLEQDPCRANGGAGGCVLGDYAEITNVQIPSKFGYVFSGLRNPSTDKYQQKYYAETVASAESLAQTLMGLFTYSGALIYDVGEANYHVVEGMGIQDAIKAATPGDTINVAAGTYDEQIVITESITLQGAGDSTIVRPSQTTANSFQLFNRTSGGLANTSGIIVTNIPGGTVNISNLKVDGSLITSTPSASRFIGILYRDSTAGTLDQVTVQGIGINEGNGILLAGFGTITAVEVSNSTVTDYRKNGITANFAGMNANIHHNVITGVGPTTAIAQNGIQIGFGAQGTIAHNIVSDNFWTGTYGGTNDPVSDPDADGATGILLYMPGSSLIQVNNNIISGNQFGISSVAAGEINISNNNVTGRVHTGYGFPTGVAIYSADMWTDDFGGTEMSTVATISDNQIGTVEYGLLVKDYVDGGAAPVVDAQNNWWGVANPNFSTLVFGNVATSPWYADAAMTTLSSEITETASEKSTVFSAETAYSSDTVNMTIPEGTTITGPLTWDGIFNLPEVTTTYTIPSESNGFWYKPTLAIEMGAEGAALTFDKPVKLTFTGQADKSAGWSQNGTFHKITSTCTSATAPTLEAGADCKIDVGSDLIVWTRHATAFIAFAEEAIPYGGGGGNSASSVVVPTTPASQVAQTAVANTPNTTGQVLGTTISEQASGKSQGKVLGASTASFARDMSVGMRGEDIGELQKMLIAEGLLSGEATNYFGTLTKAALAEWQKDKGLPATGYFGSMTRKALSDNESPKPTVRGANTFNFSKNLRFGLKGTEVTELQKILMAEGYLKITTATDYFGPMTKAALVQWQKDNNLPATGYFGPMSREVMLK